ncbi:MAG: histidinol dehydrogenase [Casimicrobiaceae bacterium]|nr:histidinol dehydrogenase [Casimicrobiaceae bacterium]MCX8098439.1 histidinol dehydrogenase [Casimicrobiaceae bacterium]MDW8311151.1 histidinol dehydrogenase [Burkholderiales bacterium]
MKRLSTSEPHFWRLLQEATQHVAALDPQIDAAVAEIIEAVRTRGDRALLDYTARFDRVHAASVAELEIARDELEAAYAALPATLAEALGLARERIEAYHRRQLPSAWRIREADGTELGVQITPLDRVGLYVPGGRAAYPSSVLMNAVPAKVAGVAEIIMVVPTPDGARNHSVLAAAYLAGVDRVFTVGGAQAIAALAYGTETIPPVDKIVGPGNAYVAAAKRRVFGTVGIDMIAGPSEILVLADESARIDWVTMDLFSQAEHDELAQAILVSPSRALIEAVLEAIERLLPDQPRRATIAASLAQRGLAIETRSLEEACAVANAIAPEHLELAVADPEALLPQIRHAGAIFLGHASSEALGDYVAGTNHVLPTSRAARYASPLGVYDFQKRTSILRVSPEGARRLGRAAAVLAQAEGLPAHARAAELRVEDEA